MTQRILVYGATGYTGKLVAAEAAARGLDVVLAGRDAEKLKAVAEPLGFESRAAALDDAPALEAALEGMACVLHVAGPFSETARPMIDACLSTGTHYLDVTGEIDVFEAIARRDAEAREAGVLLLPGVGFDVVPSDCLAAHTAARIDQPATLRIALAGMGARMSRGTARTAIESWGEGLRVRQQGVLERRTSGSLERYFDFGAGPARGLAMPWGDVSTAFYSTGIPDIEVYFILSGRLARLIKASRFAETFMRVPAIRSGLERFLKTRVETMPEGPTETELEGGRTFLLAEVESADGTIARSLLETPSGYTLTPVAAVEAARRAASEEMPTGFHTPATAFGADFVLTLAGCKRRDLETLPTPP